MMKRMNQCFAALLMLLSVSLFAQDETTDAEASASATPAAEADQAEVNTDADTPADESATADVGTTTDDSGTEATVAAASPAEANPAVCAACHGADGNSAVPQWPKIAGQHEQYLLRQSLLIQSGDRSVPAMMPIVAGMPEEQLAALAAYYSEQTLTPGVADESQVDLGRKIYRAGVMETGVPACMACHGPGGLGDPLVPYPRLAGQHALYTETMLKQYRDGQTWGEDDVQSQIMVGVAAEMTDEQIQAVSSFLQGLHVPTED